METTLQVWVRYYGNQYVGRVLKVTRKAVTVEITVGRGRRHERKQTLSVSITPTAKQHETRGHQPVRFVGASADEVTRQTTAFPTFRAMVDARGDYRPTLVDAGLTAILANTYDREQWIRGSERRAERRSAPQNATQSRQDALETTNGEVAV